MRIICPNCDAQYEVPDEVIPDEGRDVQCSSCGTTWTFEHADRPKAEGDGEAESPDPDADDDGAALPPIATPPRRELDPEVAGILRAEAEREAAARAAEGRPQPLEVQPDLGLTEASRPPPHRKTAGGGDAKKPAGKPAATAQAGNMTVAAAAAAGSRGDMLPDVEEINSTLRSTGDRGMAHDARDAEAEDRMRRRRGFRGGLLVAVLIFVACLLVYQFAPEIAEAVPQADPWLSDYVTWVDGARAELDANVRAMLRWLDAQAAASGE